MPESPAFCYSLYPIFFGIEIVNGTVTWQGGAAFKAASGTGHEFMIDGPPDQGGENLGVRPMELLLLGVAGCSSFDVMSMLRKGRQDVRDCVCDVSAERADAVPAVFTCIHLHFRIKGTEIKESQVKRAVRLSAEKYCSASIMLEAAGVEISHSYEIEAA